MALLLYSCLREIRIVRIGGCIPFGSGLGLLQRSCRAVRQSCFSRKISSQILHHRFTCAVGGVEAWALQQ